MEAHTFLICGLQLYIFALLLLETLVFLFLGMSIFSSQHEFDIRFISFAMVSLNIFLVFLRFLPTCLSSYFYPYLLFIFIVELKCKVGVEYGAC